MYTMSTCASIYCTCSEVGKINENMSDAYGEGYLIQFQGTMAIYRNTQDRSACFLDMLTSSGGQIDVVLCVLPICGCISTSTSASSYAMLPLFSSISYTCS